MSTTILIGAIGCYSLAALLMLAIFKPTTAHVQTIQKQALFCAWLALSLQVCAIFLIMSTTGNLDFSLRSMTLLISAILVSTFLLACFGLEISRLGILVFPLTAISLFFAASWPAITITTSTYVLLPISAISSHIIVAILAYSFLTLGTIQALLYTYQEKQLKKRAMPNVLANLPPLQTMETLLFRLLGLGFALLTLTLLSGALFSRKIFGYAFDFNHHTVLAIMGWIVFATLLGKHYLSGVRGTHAAIWSLSGFLLIQLGYFGTKFISESLNLA